MAINFTLFYYTHFKLTIADYCKRIYSLFDFLHNKINALFIREIFLSSSYFNDFKNLDYKNSLNRFFNPQKNTKNFKEPIKNVVWDLNLLMYMERCMLVLDDNYDFTIPYLFTGDKGLCSLINEMPIDTFAFKTYNKYEINNYGFANDVHKTYFKDFYKKIIDEKCLESIKVFLNNKASLERKQSLNSIKNPNLYYETIIQELEEKISQWILKK